MDFGHLIIGLTKTTFDGPASLLVTHTVGKKQAEMLISVENHAG